MAIRLVRDVVTYAHVREFDPKAWVDIGLSARTPAPGVKKALLVVRRIDGPLQKWVFTPGAIYVIAQVGLLIQGNIETPIPPV
jgi:hypothetical protein